MFAPITKSRALLAIAVFIGASAGSTVGAQELIDTPIRMEIGGTPGGGLFFTGGDDDAEANFNVYTFSSHLDYYLTQKVAVEAEYMFGNGWGQDIVFRNGLLVGQQTPFSHTFTGGALFYPRGATGTRLPFYLSGGVGMMSFNARPTTKKLGYDPDGNSGETFTVSRIGVGLKIPRGVSAPNWSFRMDYRLLFINANDGAPAFFASSKSRTGHQVQFGFQYALRR
jgi:hypothetical protein